MLDLKIGKSALASCLLTCKTTFTCTGYMPEKCSVVRDPGLQSSVKLRSILTSRIEICKAHFALSDKKLIFNDRTSNNKYSSI